ncbi:DJ-1/PfpI family protein [Halalkalibacter oceani]|uniref:DJ-1/PfpI family protein n=1 Tax=Halalkalibacter oceani TaxID=1653776 RepID=UPI0033994621
MHIQIVLFDGFDVLDVIAPYEVFTAAAACCDQEVTVELVSAEGARLVRSGVNQLPLQANAGLDPTRDGLILVPGAAGAVDDGPDSIPHKLQQAANTELGPLLKEAAGKPDLLLATVCGGSLILAMAGLVAGRHAVTHHLGMELLKAMDAIPVHARVVDDGDLVSGGGVTSGLDVGLYLVERELGPRIAHAVEQLFAYERRGTVWSNSGSTPLETEPQAEDEFPALPKADASPTIEGDWEATIATPIGKQHVLFSFTNKDGRLTGTATQGEETVRLEQLTFKGNEGTWSMNVTKPMRLSLKFRVVIDNNHLHGEAKAGLLPASRLTGRRTS